MITIILAILAIIISVGNLIYLNRCVNKTECGKLRHAQDKAMYEEMHPEVKTTKLPDNLFLCSVKEKFIQFLPSSKKEGESISCPLCKDTHTLIPAEWIPGLDYSKLTEVTDIESVNSGFKLYLKIMV